MPVRNTGYDFKNKTLLPFLPKKLLIDYVDILVSQSNCVILSVEDAKKAGRFKNNLTKLIPIPDGKKITLKTHVWEGIYTISYDTMKKGFM